MRLLCIDRRSGYPAIPHSQGLFRNSSHTAARGCCPPLISGPDYIGALTFGDKRSVWYIPRRIANSRDAGNS